MERWGLISCKLVSSAEAHGAAVLACWRHLDRWGATGGGKGRGGVGCKPVSAVARALRGHPRLAFTREAV